MGWLRFHVSPWLWFICALTIFGKGQGQGELCIRVYMCCQRSFELRLAKISMETVSNIWRFSLCLQFWLSDGAPVRNLFAFRGRRCSVMTTQLGKPDRQTDRGREGGRVREMRRFPNCVQVKPFFGFHLLSGLPTAPDEPVASQAKFHFSCHLSLSLFLSHPLSFSRSSSFFFY